MFKIETPSHQRLPGFDQETLDREERVFKLQKQFGLNLDQANHLLDVLLPRMKQEHLTFTEAEYKYGFIYSAMDQHLIPIKRARELLALDLNFLQQKRVIAKAEELEQAEGNPVSYREAMEILKSEDRAESKQK